MKDEYKTKKKLIEELKSLRRENRELKDELQAREEKYKIFYENSLIPMYITTMDDGKVVDANKSESIPPILTIMCC